VKLALAWALAAGVYLLALASVDPWDVGAAVLVGGVAVVPFRRFLFGDGGLRTAGLGRRALALVPLVLVVLRDITAGTWQVALVVLHLRPLRSPGIVAVPIGERSELGITVSGFLATLSPGDFLVDVDRERRVLLVHVLDASDPDAVRARFRHFYDRWQRPVFP
jgi:multisubunit Na+/H+ antiporter MnhE subunit